MLDVDVRNEKTLRNETNVMVLTIRIAREIANNRREAYVFGYEEIR